MKGMLNALFSSSLHFTVNPDKDTSLTWEIPDQFLMFTNPPG